MIRALVVDDERLARERIRELLRPETDVRVVADATTGLEAVRLIEELRPDLVFLDVQMPELDGFGVVQAVGVDRMPPTLFVTAYDRHAVMAFEVHAIDYLLKPFDPERFRRALTRVRAWRTRPPGGSPALENVLARLRDEPRYVERLLVRRADRYVLVLTRAIRWIEAEDNYVRLHAEGESHLLRQTLAQTLATLDPKQFRRIHRGAIVNLDFVRELQPWADGDMLVLLRDGTQLKLSRTYRDQLVQ